LIYFLEMLIRRLIHYFLVFLVLGVVSCKETKEIEIPPNVLPKGKMAEIVTDLTLIEANINIGNLYIGKANADSTSRFNVYKQYGTTRKVYDSSLVFYSKHPIIFKEVYEMVLERLNKMQNNK
jgi:hypothetical protein